MAPRILIVEDEIMVAANLEAVLDDLGMAITGIAADTKTALTLATRGADIAFVDLNLRDGLTGPEIARELRERFGMTVLFMTANPRVVSDGVDGILGVVAKPVHDHIIEPIVNYALKVRAGAADVAPPRGLQVFQATG